MFCVTSIIFNFSISIRSIACRIINSLFTGHEVSYFLIIPEPCIKCPASFISPINSQYNDNRFPKHLAVRNIPTNRSPNSSIIPLLRPPPVRAELHEKIARRSEVHFSKSLEYAAKVITSNHRAPIIQHFCRGAKWKTNCVRMEPRSSYDYL